MPFKLPFKQVDVFTSQGFKGNPVAVINCMGIEESQVTTEQLQGVANWTNLSETTFLFKPTDSKYDYKLRIFTPKNELPFAGHPTVGSCKAYLEFSGKVGSVTTVYQECGVGIVELTVSEGKISFQAEKTVIEDLDEQVANQYCETLGVKAIAPPKLLKVGPNWVVILVEEAQSCYDSNPDYQRMAEISDVNDHTGVILGGKKAGTDNQYEMRAFAPVIKVEEDPVCGSGALSFIRYLNDLNKYEKSTPIDITQGGRLGRNGRISGLIKIQEDGSITYHIGGDALTVIEGQILL